MYHADTERLNRIAQPMRMMVIGIEAVTVYVKMSLAVVFMRMEVPSLFREFDRKD